MTIKKKMVSKIPALVSSLALAVSVFSSPVIVATANEIQDATPENLGSTDYYSRVEYVSRYYNRVNYMDLLGSCMIRTAGVGCDISITVSATRTIQTGVGLGLGAVASNLSISSSTTKTMAVSCKYPPAAVGTRYHVFPYGTEIYYNINRYVSHFWGRETKLVESSPRLFAFDPVGVSC